MSLVLRSPEADNIEEIWWYVAQDSPESAARLFDWALPTLRERILESCFTLVGNFWLAMGTINVVVVY
jgi:hypothetical protein